MQQVPDVTVPLVPVVAMLPDRPVPCQAFISLVNDIVNTRDFYDVVFLANTCSSQIMLEEKGDALLILDLGSLSERFRCGLLFSFSCNGNGRGFVFAC